MLRREGEHFEIISNGVFLMDTRNGESERALVRAALERAPAPQRVLIGGLGVGFSLQEALKDERVARVTVVEIEPAIVEWHETHLAHLTCEARRDARTHLVISDISEVLRASDEATYDAICLDVDNGPDWTVTDANAGLYGDDGTSLIASRMRSAGVLTVWSATRSAAYEQVLARHFRNVETMEIPVPRGEPDIVFAATGPMTDSRT